MLARHGYGVLLFDRRGEGSSEGDGNMLGWGGDKDIIAAVDWLQAPAGRRPRPHRRDRPLGRRRADARGRRETDDLAAVVSDGAGARQFREEKEEFLGRRAPLDAPGVRGRDRTGRRLLHTAPPPTLPTWSPRIAPRPLF